ncbi:GntR family transcriptional regulator [Ruminococcaceae bacterium BL-6]|jgi:DNA-binding GntR family transcriptional regulator|nr:GntR family transcriptional regulator [Ruminococcaceae bacterium BL-6]HBC27744.1 GntR family transcriptional regulator [Oscillospiraceae bacterium]HCA28766.1 GntR family transcriptional regulator [Oscillospiraceae bacterium]
MSELKPIQLLPAREQIASSLRKAILSRELREGETITLDEIALQLGVSITPVREAFQILARDGLIKLHYNKGAVVLGISPKTIHDHYETRAILEREAAAAVCRNQADLSGIIRAYEQAKLALEQNRSQKYSNYNQAFHFAIWTAAGNEKMKALLSEMWNGLSMGHKVTEEAYAKISIAEHEQILEALKSRDEDLARQRMNHHIMRSMQNILTRF